MKSWKYNKYITYKIQYICVFKKHYIKYVKLKKKYKNYKDLSLKYKSEYRKKII